MLEGGVDGVLNKLDFIFNLPEKPDNPTARKAAKLAFCVAVIAIGGILFGVMLKSLDVSTLANPNPLKLMGFILPIGVTGGGIALLLQHIIPKKYHHAASRIMSIATVFFVIGAGMLMMKMAYDVTPAIPDHNLIFSNPWFWTGAVLAAGGGVYAIGHAIPFPNMRQPGLAIEDYEDEIEMQRREEQKRLIEQAANQNPVV